MEQFKIRQGGFTEVKKKILLRIIPLLIVAITVGLGIGLNKKDDNVNVLSYVIPIAVLAGFGIYRGVNRQKNLFESYTISISEDSIAREQTNTPTIKIAFTDVNEIIKNSNGSFIIKGRTALDVIGIPAQIDNYAHIETTLNHIKPIHVLTKKSAGQKLTLPITFATLGLMATVYIATNKILVGISGTLLTGILIYSFIQIQRNKNIDSKTKRAGYWLIPVLLSIVAITFIKFSGK
jgi:hypothetical protein